MTTLLMRSAALAALIASASCGHSDYSLASGFGAGAQNAPIDDTSGSGSGSGSGAGSGSGSGSGADGSGDSGGISRPQSAGVLADLTGQGAEVLASSGNVGGLLNGSGQAGAQSLALNVGADGGQQGSAATVGVLSNGQVVSASLSGDGATNLPGNLANTGNLPDTGNTLGVTAGDQQVIGASSGNVLGVGLAADQNAQGQTASVNTLSGGQTANVQVGALGGGDVTGGVTNTLDGATSGLSLGGLTNGVSIGGSGASAGVGGQANTGLVGAITGAVNGAVNTGN